MKVRGRALVADASLAVALFVLSLAGLAATPEIVLGHPYRHTDTLAIALLVLMSLPLVWRRRRPVTVLAIVGVATTAYSLRHYLPSGAGIGVLIALYTVAAYCERRVSIRAGVLTALGVGVSLYPYREELGVAGVVANAGVFVIGWILGDSIRTRRAYTRALEERTERLEREREREAREAVAAERARIARELHDVVAHDVSVMVVQAGAARRVLDQDPARAREAMASVEDTGRQALNQLRRLLGVLRNDDEADWNDDRSQDRPDRTPQPSIAHLASLLDRVREAGVPVELSVEGDPHPLPEGVDLSAFRIIQEALTNTMKHAGPAAATVFVRYLPNRLEVEVTDDGRGAAQELARQDADADAGQGLIGMRERVALFGGELKAGPRTGGGWIVRARLPLEPART